MMDSERVNWVRLSRANLSARQMKALAERFGTAADILRAGRSEYAGVDGVSERAAEKIEAAKTDALVDRDIERIERMGARIVLLDDPEYPVNLKQIYDPPSVLYVLGELCERDKWAFAIVGTRKCTDYGRRVAQRLARDLADHGMTVVSGLAYGVDRAAHEGALAAKGRTIGVSACGLDLVYPAPHADLYKEVAAHGAVISESPLGTRPERWRFPARNRIISGLSLGVLVVEAPEKSGALITATCASEQGRDVFAVPGNVFSGTSKGVHGLIRDGAKLVDDVKDILTEIGPPGWADQPFGARETAGGGPEAAADLSPTQAAILNVLGSEEKSVDTIIEESRLPVGQVSSELTMLELMGLARRLPGNCYVREC
jgi:DNA processing protein